MYLHAEELRKHSAFEIMPRYSTSGIGIAKEESCLNLIYLMEPVEAKPILDNSSVSLF
jgi:hypothetical protein